MRSVEEWVGKTDDSKIPDRVRIRVFEKYRGICYRSGVKIMPGDDWDCDHIIALANGGRHAEDNLAPILRLPHRAKTKEDRKIQSRIYKVRKRHLGLAKPKGRPMPGTKASGWKRKLDGSWERR
jgi:5-methylcytosine-specific restriction endonuclease McrA